MVNFSDEAFIDQDFTADENKLRDGLSHIDSRGGTALYDAVVASANKLVADAKRLKQVLVRLPTERTTHPRWTWNRPFAACRICLGRSSTRVVCCSVTR